MLGRQLQQNGMFNEFQFEVGTSYYEHVLVEFIIVDKNP